MTGKELVSRRMENQRIVGGEVGTPEALLRWMGCVQAQDFGQAKWAIGVRGGADSEAVVDTAFNAGRILRTHVLRPTWHFVLPSDIRWMLQLSAPRIRQLSRPYYKKLELDAGVFKRSRKVLRKALEDGSWRTRVEIAELFRRAKIDTDDIRMNFLLMDAELEGLVCSGPRKGKQFTYTLLEGRVSGAQVLTPEEGVGELAARYFSSRGPATLADFAWWSGLTVGQAKMGLEMVKGQLDCEKIGGNEYWFCEGGSESGVPPPALLLPAFDEFMVAYKDRTHVLPREYGKESSSGLKPVILVDGVVRGSWKRSVREDTVELQAEVFEDLSKGKWTAVEKEARRYAVFAGGKLTLFRS